MNKISKAQAIEWLRAQSPEVVDELVEELRKKQRPAFIETPDLSNLTTMLEAGIDHIIEYGYESDDFEHYVFEECMNTFYGNDIWDWYNGTNEK